jgi:hypothetical protein
MSLLILECFSNTEIKHSSVKFKIEIVIYLLVGNQKLVSRKHNISHPAVISCTSDLFSHPYCLLGTMLEGRIRKEGLGLSLCAVPLT